MQIPSYLLENSVRNNEVNEDHNNNYQLDMSFTYEDILGIKKLYNDSKSNFSLIRKTKNITLKINLSSTLSIFNC